MNKSRKHLSWIAGTFRRVGGFLVFALILSTSNLVAGVLVAPTVIFLSSDARTGRMTLQNLGDTPQEVTVFFSFGLPTADSLGDVRVQLQDSAITDPKACLDWVKAFPRKLIMPANGTQVVRFVANPPRDLVDGEYWARIVVKAQDATANIPEPTGEGQITTKLNMVMQTAVMLKYRHGEVFCELELNGATATQRDQTVEVMIDANNVGNASYLGILSCQVVDANGREIATKSTQLAIYRDMRRRLMIPVPEGDYVRPFEVNLSITSKGRTDIAAEDMLYGNDIEYSAVVE